MYNRIMDVTIGRETKIIVFVEAVGDDGKKRSVPTWPAGTVSSESAGDWLSSGSARMIANERDPKRLQEAQFMDMMRGI